MLLVSYFNVNNAIWCILSILKTTGASFTRFNLILRLIGDFPRRRVFRWIARINSGLFVLEAFPLSCLGFLRTTVIFFLSSLQVFRSVFLIVGQLLDRQLWNAFQGRLRNVFDNLRRFLIVFLLHIIV